MKLLLFYTTTLAMLFGALTVLFNAIGVGEAAPPAPVEQAAPPVEPEAEPEKESDPYEGIRHPYLLRGRYYTVSLDTPLFAKQEIDDIADQLLPAGGVFRVTKRIDAPDGLWYQVAVSNGQYEYRYFVRAYDLNWTKVRRYLPNGRRTQQQAAADHADLIAIKGIPRIDIRKSIMGDREEELERAERLRQQQASREQQESELESLGMTIRTGLHTFNSNGWLSAAMLAGLVTLAIAGFLGMTAWYRVTHRWSSGRDIDALWSEDGPDMDQSETENARQAQPQIEQKDDPYA